MLRAMVKERRGGHDGAGAGAGDLGESGVRVRYAGVGPRPLQRGRAGGDGGWPRANGRRGGGRRASGPGAAESGGARRRGAVAVTPEVLLATTDARRALPAQVSLGDAVFNVNRAALLVAAFSQGRFELLREAGGGRLHPPYPAPP